MQLRRTATPINASNLAFELTDVEYTIDVTLDDAERTVEVPSELAAAFASDPALAAAWEAWSYTRRREAATGITDAKKPDTRARRVATALAALRHP